MFVEIGDSLRGDPHHIIMSAYTQPESICFGRNCSVKENVRRGSNGNSRRGFWGTLRLSRDNFLHRLCAESLDEPQEAIRALKLSLSSLKISRKPIRLLSIAPLPQKPSWQSKFCWKLGRLRAVEANLGAIRLKISWILR